MGLGEQRRLRRRHRLVTVAASCGSGTLAADAWDALVLTEDAAAQGAGFSGGAPPALMDAGSGGGGATRLQPPQQPAHSRQRRRRTQQGRQRLEGVFLRPCLVVLPSSAAHTFVSCFSHDIFIKKGHFCSICHSPTCSYVILISPELSFVVHISTVAPLTVKHSSNLLLYLLNIEGRETY